MISVWEVYLAYAVEVILILWMVIGIIQRFFNVRVVREEPLRGEEGSSDTGGSKDSSVVTEKPDRSEYWKQWYEKNRERKLANDKIYQQNHREEQRIRDRERYEERKEYFKNWREETQYDVKYYQEHKKEVQEKTRNWYRDNPEKAREIWRRKNISRRELPPVEVVLNERFDGSHFHHMGDGVAVYIPEGLHMMIHHSLKNDENMEEINWAVIEWLCGEGSKQVPNQDSTPPDPRNPASSSTQESSLAVKARRLRELEEMTKQE